VASLDAAVLRALVSLALLGYAAYSDFKTREVDDLVWIILCATSMPFVLLQLVELERRALIAYVLSAYLAFLLGFTLSAFKLWGWADFLALACIGLTNPPPSGGGYLSLLPSISTLVNSLLVSCAYPLFLLAENSYLIAKGERVFEGVEASLPIKVIAFFTLRNIPAQVYLQRRNFYSLAERFEGGKRYITLRIGAEEEAETKPLPSRVWVSPYMPFVTLLAIGYAIHLTAGCLLDRLPFAPLAH
jgi:Flp pilus assembly protein protease CpaA